MFQQIHIECFDVRKLGSKTHGTTAVGLAAAKMASSCAGIGFGWEMGMSSIMGWPTPWQISGVPWLRLDRWSNFVGIQISADPLAHNWPHFGHTCGRAVWSYQRWWPPKLGSRPSQDQSRPSLLKKLWRVHHPNSFGHIFSKFEDLWRSFVPVLVGGCTIPEPNLTTEAANCHSPWQMGLPKLGLSRTLGPCPSCSVTWHPSRWDQPLWVKAVQNLQTVHDFGIKTSALKLRYAVQVIAFFKITWIQKTCVSE